VEGSFEGVELGDMSWGIQRSLGGVWKYLEATFSTMGRIQVDKFGCFLGGEVKIAKVGPSLEVWKPRTCCI
jgi:hypothetical protein